VQRERGGLRFAGLDRAGEKVEREKLHGGGARMWIMEAVRYFWRLEVWSWT